MEQFYCKKNIWIASIAAGLLVSAFIFFMAPLAQSAEKGDITSALKDLSTTIGQEVTSKEQAVAICDSEKYFEICAGIGKEHNLYNPEEIKQVDTFINEVRGAVAEQLKSCQTTECLIGVANELAKKVTAKDPKLAEGFELTTKFVEKKQAVITAAKEAGVDYDTCRNMNPDTADIAILRACAKLAKDSRVRGIIPEAARAQAEQYGEYVDKSVELRSSLQSGEFKCGSGSLESCGDFCLNPSDTTRAQGPSSIPPVCRQIAQKFFGADGIKQLEQAYGQVQQTQNFYKKKSENILFTTLDGRTLTRPEDIGNYMEEQGRQGNVEAVEKGMNYMVVQGFIKPEEKEFALKFVKQARDSGGPIDFDKCSQNPEACRNFIPEKDRGQFDTGFKMQEIMKQELGFDPRQCQNAASNPELGQKCFEASKRALPQLENFANQSPEIRRFVNEIKVNVGRAEQFNNQRGQLQQAFQQVGGGPGGCKSEQECSAYCSDPSHSPECIAFGAKQGISGFQGTEAVEKFQQYNKTLQRSQFGGSEGGFFPPGQGYSVQGGFPGQGGQQGFPFPGQGYPVQGGFPGQGYPVQGSFPGGQGIFPPGGPVGPSPECFAAIQSGDFARAKTVCAVQLPTSQPIGQICPSLPTVDNCPVGEIKVVSYSSPECGTFYTCQRDYIPVTYSPYPTSGEYHYCPPPSYWDEASRSCRGGGQQGSYTPVPSCPAGQHWEYYANSCKPDGYLPSPGGSYSPYPTYSSLPSCPAGQHWEYYANSCKPDGYVPSPNGSYSPYPTYSSPPSCPTGQWWDYARNACQGSTSSYTPFPSPGTCPAGQYWYWPPGGGAGYCQSNTATYSPYPSPSGSSSCSQSLVNLLGTGCHFMYTDVSDPNGRSIFCDGPMTKSAKEGDTVATAGCTSGSATYSPFPTSSPTSGGSCPSGAHTMYVNNAGGYCMSDADTTKCGPLNSTSTSSFTNSCSSYGGSTSPSPTSTYTYSPSPTGGTTSCPSGSHSMGSYCMSDADSTKCGTFGSTSTSTFTSCSSFGGGTYSPAPTYTAYPSCPSGQWWDPATSSCKLTTTTSYSPYPTTSYTPYPTCTVAGEWWDPATSSCRSSTTTTTYTPAPTTTTTYTPAPTTDPSASCTSSGGTWNGSSCVYPTATPASTATTCPSGQFWDSATNTCKTAFNSYQHQMAMARTIMACADAGGMWKGSSCQSASFTQTFFGNILKIFSRFIK